MKRSALLIAICFGIFSSGVTHAQKRSGVIDQKDAQRAGLKVEWTTSVETDPSYGKVVGLYLHISDKYSTTTFEIQYGGTDEVKALVAQAKAGNPEKQKIALERLSAISARHFGQKNMDKLDERAKSFADQVKQASTVREVISQFARGPSGRMYGIAGAEQAAKDRQYVLNLGRGVIATISKHVTPKTTLYASTTEGLVQAIDATTGKKLWSTMTGKRVFFTSAPVANEDFVAVTNGSSVHCLRSDTGKFIWSHTCNAAPGGAPAISDDFIFVPLVNGFVDAFPLWDQTDRKDVVEKRKFAQPDEEKSKSRIAYENAIKAERLSRYGRLNRRVSKHMTIKHFVSAGAAMNRPIVTKNTTSWPTLRGHYNVGSNSRDNVGKMRYRLKTGGPIRASGAYYKNHIFVASTDGFVYKLDERDGSLAWSLGTGEPISQTPVPVGDAVYVISNDLGLFKIDNATGTLAKRWPARVANIRSFVGASKDRLYLLNNLNQMVVLQQETGAEVAKFSTNGQNLKLYNLKTDRLYVGSTNGTIQCLSETTSNYPYIHASFGDKANTPKKPTDPVKPDGGEKNPFGDDKKKDEKNPFGDEKKKGEKNPFGKK